MQAPETVITIDVEWAHPEVLADTVRLLDERNLRATFFCTHESISVPGHERALHPNFRRNGSSHSPELSNGFNGSNVHFYSAVMSRARTFCPEAVGVRAHSLIYDSDLLRIYRATGLQYDSSYFLPLANNLQPVWKGGGMVELPFYYMDHWDLKEQATGFKLASLRLDEPGLKVVGFHPNLVYNNAASEEQYLQSKAHYHDPEWLLKTRYPGRGTRVLFLELLDWCAGRPSPAVLAEVNARWRSRNR